MNILSLFIIHLSLNGWPCLFGFDDFYSFLFHTGVKFRSLKVLSESDWEIQGEGHKDSYDCQLWYMVKNVQYYRVSADLIENTWNDRDGRRRGVQYFKITLLESSVSWWFMDCGSLCRCDISIAVSVLYSWVFCEKRAFFRCIFVVVECVT